MFFAGEAQPYVHLTKILKIMCGEAQPYVRQRLNDVLCPIFQVCGQIFPIMVQKSRIKLLPCIRGRGMFTNYLAKARIRFLTR